MLTCVKCGKLFEPTAGIDYDNPICDSCKANTTIGYSVQGNPWAPEVYVGLFGKKKTFRSKKRLMVEDKKEKTVDVQPKKSKDT